MGKNMKKSRKSGVASKQGNVNSPKLTKLAGLIKESHNQVLSHSRATVEFARKTGEYLFDAKQIVIEAGGSWYDWVEDHRFFSQDQAQRYIRIFNRYHELLAKVDDPKKLTMVEALRLLSGAPEKTSRKGRVADYRIEVESKKEYADRLSEASKLKFSERSKEQKFIDEKGEVLAKQMVSLAKARGKARKTSAAAIVMALFQKFKKVFDDSLVVKIGEDKIKSVRRLHDEDSATRRKNGLHRQAA